MKTKEVIAILKKKNLKKRQIAQILLLLKENCWMLSGHVQYVIENTSLAIWDAREHIAQKEIFKSKYKTEKERRYIMAERK